MHDIVTFTFDRASPPHLTVHLVYNSLVGPLSSCSIITHIPLIAGNLPTSKQLVARQWPTTSTIMIDLDLELKFSTERNY